MSERSRVRVQRVKATVTRSEAAQPESATGQAGRGVAPIVNRALETGGSPLGTQTRANMESRFGHDFRNVRIHTDTRADESAQAIQARAYTLGNDIVFRAGEYNPGSTDGQRLLAHELTHVVQQRGAGSTGAQAEMEVSQPGDAAEVEAESVAREVVSGREVAVSGHSVQRAVIQRAAEEEEEV